MDDQAAPESILGKQHSVNFLPLPQGHTSSKPVESAALCIFVQFSGVCAATDQGLLRLAAWHG
jgi:hypothetical protein